jgi:hypothetical protein
MMPAAGASSAPRLKLIHGAVIEISAPFNRSGFIRLAYRGKIKLCGERKG